MDRNKIDEQNTEFGGKDLGCASCINAGYTFAYKAATTAKTNTETVATTKDYDAANKCLETWGGATLESRHFKNSAVAIANCPMKTDVCGATTSASLKDKAATAVDFSVATMTGKDQCTFTVKAKCGLPVITIKEATGGFLDAKKVAVTFIEGSADEALDIDDEPHYAHDAWMGKEGSFYPVFLDTMDSLGDPFRFSMKQ